ncbi:MAG TPA: hypothetical protein VHN58_09980 [Croceicoccus sp.]|nr:hypothetical protein [Croceicoccus sp.]
MSLVSRMFRSGFVGNLGVGFSAQATQLAIQLVLVPVFSLNWGLDQYGIWLILFTVPGYLAMADLGVLPAAANVMAMHMARGERTDALATYQALRLLVGAVNLTIFAVAALLLFAARPAWLDFAQDATGGQAGLVVLLLVGYGLLTLQNGVVAAAYRAVDLYVEMGYGAVAMITLEAVCAALLVLTGHGMVAVAFGYFAVRLTGTVVMATILFFRARWLLATRRTFARHHLAALVRPALAGIALPVAQAITFQGMVMAVGAVAGAAAVPLFTATRTLTRSALQFTLIVSRATMPVYTVADATGDHAKRLRLLVAALATCLAVLLPFAVIFTVAGQSIIAVWSGGQIVAPVFVIACLALATVFGGLWNTLGNALVSINRHGLYAYANVVFAALSVGAAWLLMQRFGVAAAGVGPLLLDMAMFAWLLAVAARLRLATRAELTEAFQALPGEIRSRIGAGR